MAESASVSEALARGRKSFAGRAWADAHAQLSAADAESPLAPHDLELLARAAYLVGRETESVDALARAYSEMIDRGDAPGAARCAFLAAFQLLSRGERAQGGGWLGRARRVLEDGGHDCAERGSVLTLEALQRLAAGDVDAAYATFGEAAEIGRRFADADVMALGRLGQGQALVRSGEIMRGIGLLDEVMVDVTSGDVSPIFAGVVYCAVLEVCNDIYDLRRAHEWTTALSRWCDAQPDLVPYRGECLVRRAEIMRLHGAWLDALEAAERACDWLSRPPPRAAVGAAHYQQAELHRLRGELDEAEEAYRRANEAGRKPQPGLAQLRLSQGKVGAAQAAIRGVLDETRARRARARVLPACVEILLAAGDAAGARSGADELAEIADELSAPLLKALSAQASGAVLLAEGDPGAALAALREAATVWRELDVPYEAARTRVLIALACGRLADEDGAAMELEAARQTFERLGAAADLQRLLDASPRRQADAPGGLTPREVEVLRLVATGRTNRVVAADLCISEKTVARHLSNIFGKLGVSSRSAATAFAYEHELV